MNPLKKILTAAVLLTLSLPAMKANDNIAINHLSTQNTLVRIEPASRYVLLPIEEKVEDARINVIVDGKTDKTFFARLARNKVDYFVPFDLSEYQGKNLLFDVVTAQDRTSVREASGDACWKQIRLSDTFDTANREKYRPMYHHTPLYGWMNDPNGMFYKDGVWHLYYQYNPYGSKWQNMTWGHSTSTDLVNWEHQPLSIEPNALGAVFSGSSVVDTANTAGFGKDAIVTLYTSAGLNQIQSLAHSNDDGMTFEIYPGNPVITLDSEARDPNMFWNEETGEWNLLLAHALDHEMLIFTSPDLKTWTLQSSFGKGLGAQDGVWECPDLFELPVNGTDEKKWVLLCNLNPGGVFGGSATQYFVGDFDGKQFKVDTDADGTVPTKWMDFGKDHYATVSWANAPENRRTVIGWMSNWQYAAEVPTLQFRSANTLPRDVELFRAPDGELYMASMPSPELAELRDKAVSRIKSRQLSRKPMTVNLPKENSGVCEIQLTIEPQRKGTVELVLSNDLGEKVLMVYDSEDATFTFNRNESGKVDFSSEFPAVTGAPTFNGGGKLNLRMFIDTSSIEIFGDNGRFVMTNLVFPNEPYNKLSISSTDGKASVKDLTVYTIR